MPTSISAIAHTTASNVYTHTQSAWHMCVCVFAHFISMCVCALCAGSFMKFFGWCHNVNCSRACFSPCCVFAIMVMHVHTARLAKRLKIYMLAAVPVVCVRVCVAWCASKTQTYHAFFSLQCAHTPQSIFTRVLLPACCSTGLYFTCIEAMTVAVT